MALYDWNHDGKKNGQDNWIEHEILWKNKQTQSPTNGSGSGCLTSLFQYTVILFVAMWLVGELISCADSLSGKCAQSGCEEQVVPGGSYCELHTALRKADELLNEIEQNKRLQEQKKKK